MKLMFRYTGHHSGNWSRKVKIIIFFQDEARYRRVSPDSVSTVQSRQGWRGTCVHDFETPRWVQKRRRIDPNESRQVGIRVYEEPRRAVAIAINGKFSFLAIGTYRWVLVNTRLLAVC